MQAKWSRVARRFQSRPVGTFVQMDGPIFTGFPLGFAAFSLMLADERHGLRQSIGQWIAGSGLKFHYMTHIAANAASADAELLMEDTGIYSSRLPPRWRNALLQDFGFAVLTYCALAWLFDDWKMLIGFMVGFEAVQSILPNGIRRRAWRAFRQRRWPLLELTNKGMVKAHDDPTLGAIDPAKLLYWTIEGPIGDRAYVFRSASHGFGMDSKKWRTRWSPEENQAAEIWFKRLAERGVLKSLDIHVV